MTDGWLLEKIQNIEQGVLYLVRELEEAKKKPQTSQTRVPQRPRVHSDERPVEEEEQEVEEVDDVLSDDEPVIPKQKKQLVKKRRPEPVMEDEFLD